MSAILGIPQYITSLNNFQADWRIYRHKNTIYSRYGIFQQNHIGNKSISLGYNFTISFSVLLYPDKV